MAECWEAYSLSKNLKELDKHSFKGFRVQLQKESDSNTMDVDGAVRPVTKRERPSVITPASNKRQHQGTLDTSGGDSEFRRISLSPDDPVVQPKKSDLPAYSERKGSGQVVATFNPKELPEIEAPSISSKPKCIVSYNEFETNVKEPYRHMFTALEERSRQLERLLVEKHDEFGEIFDFGSENLAELEAVGVPRQDTICCIGRICNAVRLFSYV